MTSAFVQSLARNFEEALALMAAAVRDCPDGLWKTDLCPDEAPTAPAPHGGLHQIRQVLTGAGIEVQPMPGDRGYANGA